MPGLRNILPALLLGFTGGALMHACTAEEGGISKDEAAGVLADALCAAWFDCDCDIAGDQFTSQDQCESAEESDLQRLIDEGDEAGLTYNEDCASKLLSWINDIGCDGTLDIDQTLDYIEASTCKVFSGDAEGGQGCMQQWSGGTLLGDNCVADHYCDQGACAEIVQLPNPGDACNPMETWLCKQGALCMDIDGDGDSVCELLPSGGETCLGAGDLCGAGLTCNQDTKTCTKAPGDGQACAPGNVCGLGFGCDGDTCVALPDEDGEPCLNNQCAEGFNCRMGTCDEAPPAICG